MSSAPLNEVRISGIRFRLPEDFPPLNAPAPMAPDDVVDVVPDSVAPGGKAIREGHLFALEFAEGGRWLLSLADETRLAFDGTRTLRVQFGPERNNGLIAEAMAGAVAALIAEARGWMVLHAAALERRGGVLLLSGPSGAGKSTTTAALLGRGWRLLADDVTALRPLPDGAWMAQPCLPRLKATPDVGSLAGLETARAELLRYEGDKFAFPCGDRFCGEPAPLRAIGILHEAPQIEVARFAPPEALVELRRASYTYFTLKNSGRDEAHFQDCARMAMQMPVLRLSRPRDLGRLGELCDAIESAFDSSPLPVAGS